VPDPAFFAKVVEKLGLNTVAVKLEFMVYKLSALATKPKDNAWLIPVGA
jgi:hypothetical protein